MLRLPNLAVSAATQLALGNLQADVDAGPNFADRVALAKDLWNRKTSKAINATAFAEIRATLSKMAFGSVRCAYCEDSAADEIEHIAAKTVVPSRAFDWMNYCYACGPCNAPKGNQHATVDQAGALTRIDPVTTVDEPTAPAALLDPRVDDYKVYLEIDIGGVTQAGTQLVPTSEFRVKANLTALAATRADYTLEVLRLNREVVRKARETALIAYRASLLEYAQDKADGLSQAELDQRRDAILAMPHPSVLNELIRQSATQPKVRRAMAQAPEIETWLR